MGASCTTAQVAATVDSLANDDAVHGIIVQLPLPRAIDPAEVLAHFPAEKDADGFHPYNVGSMFVGESVYPPCTP